MIQNPRLALTRMVMGGCISALLSCGCFLPISSVAATEPSFVINPARMQQRINATKRGPDWRATKIDEIRANSVSATILYGSNVGGIQAKMDAVALVRAILLEIVAEGGHPAADWSFINVMAEQDGIRGETGTSLVRPFGSAHYDFNTDQIVYEPWAQ